MNHGGHIAHVLSDAGCIVVGFDHRGRFIVYEGFGKSEGLRGYLENVELHLLDSNSFIDMVLKHYQERSISNLPIFLIGLSMGGMTSFR
jgi:acylglycerol lipase